MVDKHCPNFLCPTKSFCKNNEDGVLWCGLRREYISTVNFKEKVFSQTCNDVDRIKIKKAGG